MSVIDQRTSTAAGNTSTASELQRVNLGWRCRSVDGAAPAGSVTHTSPPPRQGHTVLQRYAGRSQPEMGLTEPACAPKTIPSACIPGWPPPSAAEANWGESIARRRPHTTIRNRATTASTSSNSEIDPNIHTQALKQISLNRMRCRSTWAVSTFQPSLTIRLTMINGRSMPDDMDPNYASASAPTLQWQSAHAPG